MSNPEEHLQALDAIFDAVGEATAKADWSRLQELDTTGRHHIAAAVALAKSGDLPVADVRGRLDRMQELFETARVAAVKSRDEAEAALKSSGRTHQAAQAYLKNVKK